MKPKNKTIDTEKTPSMDDHSWVLEQLAKAQEADHDNREMAREAALFVSKRDGQWEPYWLTKNDGKPKYTFDLTGPVIDQIVATMTKQDYEIQVHPGGGDASMDVADTYEGLVRHIQDISNADEVYARTGKSMVIKGLSGFEIKQKYVDGDSFEQDLVISGVPNWIDSVWFGPHTEPDASDATFAFKTVAMPVDVYRSEYPDESEGASVSSDRSDEAYDHKPESVEVGALYYLKEEPRELVMMSNGNVYENNASFKAVQDELAQLGFTVMDTRIRKTKVCYIRKFNNDDWLGPAQKTVFRNWLPLVPMYANFDYLENKIVYYGAVEKLQDAQRVFNYSLSREVEEGALSPRAKYWMTETQAEGHEDTLKTLNTNSDPVQFFNPDAEYPMAPVQSGGAMINPGLRTISDAMQNIVGMSAGMYNANMGDAQGFMQSGKAIEALQSRGDDGNNKFIMAREVAMRQAGRILVSAIPRVYLPGRQVRILQQDGSAESQTIGQTIIDQQTGEQVTLSELEQGVYDVTCSSGPSFQSRQSQTVTAMTEIGALDPSIIAGSADILLGNIDSPGMDKVAKRKRRELFMAGLIPPDEMSQEEQQQMQQMQGQEQAPDPMMVAAQAEEAKAQADIIEAQTAQQESQAQIQQKMQELEVKRFEAETKRIEIMVQAEKVGADVKGIMARASKDLADAEAQDIENSATEAGIMKLVEQAQGGAFGG